MKGYLVFALGVLGLGGLLGAQSPTDWIKNAEALMFPEARATASLVFTAQDGRRETYDMVFYAKDRNQKVMVQFTAPASSVGNDLMMIEQNVWYRDKKSSRIIKVPSNQSFGGTGFSYGDVVRLNFSDNYTPVISGEDAKTITLDLTAKNREAPYFKIVLILAKEGYPLRGTCYSRDGSVLKVMEYSRVTALGGKVKPLDLKVTSPKEPGNVTLMSIKTEEPYALDDRVFNKRNLETGIPTGLARKK